MRVTVDVNQRMISNIQRRLGGFEKQAPHAIRRALNRAVTNVKSNVKKEVRKEYNIKSGDVEATLTVTKAATSDLRAGVHSSGKPIGLDKFKVSPKTINPKRKSPIKIGVKKSSLTKVTGAFVADINGSKVFKRTTKKRTPINRLFGPSVPQMLGNDKVAETIQKKGNEKFQERLEHEISRILEKGRG